jgi:PAS domain S-box-containing protein
MKSMSSTIERTNEEEILKILVEQASVGVCIMQDGKFRYINSVFSSDTGYTANELVGKDSFKIVVPEDREMVRENTMKMLKGELRSPYQFRVVCKDGSIRWIMAAVKSVQYHGRRAILGNYMEITWHKQIEDALKESEERYRELANSITDVFFAMDEHLRYTYWNKASEALTGIRAEDAIGKSIREIFPDEPWRRRAEKVYRSVLKTQQPQTFVNDYDINDRHYILEISAYPSRGGIAVFVSDITERKQAEDRLKESEQKYRLLFETSPDCIAQIDREGRYITANTATARSLGVSLEELNGKAVYEVVPRKVAQHRLRMMRKALDEWQTQIFEDERAGKYFYHIVIPIKTSDQKEAVQVITRDVTERRKMEETLRESEKKLRLISENSRDIICLHDPDHRYVYISPACKEVLGYEPDELVGTNPWELVHPEDIEALQKEGQEEALRGMPALLSYRIRKKSGEYIWFESVSQLLKDVAGNVSGFVTSSRDITERKSMEEAINLQRAYFQQLFDNSPDAILMTDTNSKVIQANKGSEVLFGYSNEEVKGQSLTELIVPEVDVQEASDSFQRILGGEVIRKESVRRRKDGSLVDVSILAYPIRSNDKLIGLYGVYSDISERKQAEEKLRQSEERYRALFDSSVIGTLLLDAKTMKVLMGNEAALKIFGFSSLEEGVGINVLDFVPQEDREINRELIKRELFEQDSRRDYDVRAITKDGREIWINVTGVRMMHKGRLVGMVTFTDVTERKQAEEALRQSEERYRTILEEMEDAYFEVDLGGHLTFVNDSVCRDLGYSREELIGMSYKNFTIEEDIESVFRVFNEVYQTGVPNKGFPWKTIRKDGSHGFAETSISSLRNDKGEIIGFRGVGRDITERKQAEDKLRQSNENYRALFESSVIGALVVDAKTMEVVMANQAAMIMFGFNSPEAGVNPLDFVPPEDRQKNLELIVKEVFEKDSREAIDLPAVTKDGRKIWVSATGARITHNGKLAGLFSFTDITERKLAEEKLRQSEENYKTLFNSSVTGMYVLDIETMKVVMGNRAAAEMAGFSSTGEGIGINPFDFIIPEAREQFLETAAKEFEQGLQQTHEIPVLAKDGETGWISISSARIMHEGRLAALVSFTDITERKQAEEVLQAERNKLQSIIDAMQDGLTIQDRDYNIIFQNEPARISSGGDHVGEKCYRIYEGNETICKDCPVKKSFKDGKPHVSERQRVLPSGELSFWETTSNPIRDAKGRVAACLEIGRNITERTKQEQALADELTRRRLLIDQSLDGIVVLDVDAKVVEANQRFAEMLGYTLEEVHELHTWDWDKQYPHKKILEMGRGVDEKGFHLETKHTCKDGSVIDVDISIHGAMCAGQKLIFCVCRDITERNKMDKALKQAAEEWKRTFDSISDAISIHDREFRILQANKAFADIFQMEPSQIIGVLCYELHKGQKPHSGCPHKQTLATKEPAAAEFYESNLEKYLHESTSPIFDEKGEVIATVHITRDVTEQKQQNERLMMTDRLASIGELASGAAHELNNPLTSIIGFSQLLMEREVPDDIREDLKLINNEAQRAAVVTNNLLAFARKHTPTKQLNQINNIIEDVLELRAHEHKVNHIDVDRHFAPNLPEILVDYFQMQQVFMNIIINAEYFITKAHNEGTLTITSQKENSIVRISIADDGPGIPPENLGRIFDPFFTTKEAGKGTGLGLSICHGIVTEHGGQIYARSQLGKGATIFVELPIKNRAQIKSTL